MDTPYKSSQVAAVDWFRYNTVPGNVTLPDDWESPSDRWTTNSEFDVRTYRGGELIYMGELNGDLTDASGRSNYYVTVVIQPRRNLAFEIRGRRSNASNYVAFRVDFDNDLISLLECNAGARSTIATSSHTLFTNIERKYIVSFYMYSSRLIGQIHGYPIIEKRTSHNIGVEGVSLNVDDFTDDPYNDTTFHSLHFFLVRGLYRQPPMALEGDPTRLDVIFRKQMKEWIENPYLDYRSFADAYRINRIYNPESVDIPWRQLGYPIREPSTEQWVDVL